MLLSNAVLFTVGMLGFVMGLLHVDVGLSPLARRIVVGALLVAAVTRFVPAGLALYAGAAGMVVALGLLALAVLRTGHAGPVRD